MLDIYEKNGKWFTEDNSTEKWEEILNIQKREMDLLYSGDLTIEQEKDADVLYNNIITDIETLNFLKSL